MKTSILNNEFKDIKTAALYKANEDVPFKVLYLGSNTKINKNNFSKYSNKFEPASENDELLINFLGDITKNKIENDIEILQVIENNIFPTINEYSTINSTGFFGSVSISENIYTSLYLESGCALVKLFDEYVTDYSNPSILITLGPDSKEIDYEKTIWVATSTKGDVGGRLNVSLNSWTSSLDPCRNMDSWVLRGDRRISTQESSKIINIKGKDSIIDRVTGNILGNTKIKNTPLLSKKLERVKSTANKTNQLKKFRVGNIVNDWICVNNTDDREKYSNPILSSDWINYDIYNGTFIKKVSVIANPSNSGIITPSGLITIEDITQEKEFSVKGKFGYSLDESNPCSINSTTYLPSEHYTIEKVDDHFEITITNWEEIVKSGNLIFNFNSEFSFIELIAIINGGTIQYEDWGNYGIHLDRYLMNNVETEIEIVDGSLKVSPNTKIKLFISSDGKYSIESIESTSTNFSSTNDGSSYVVTDEVDFRLAIYKVMLHINQVQITIENTNGIVASNNYVTGESGMNSEFLFYGDFTKAIINDSVEIGKDQIGQTITFNNGLSTAIINTLEENMYKLELFNILIDTNILLC